MDSEYKVMNNNMLNKEVTDWSKTDTAKHLIDRGFTGQQHVDNFALINFNGRMYDPVLAHFLSPDPYIQNPENPLNHNRYAYCLFSPLQYVDPSGFFVDWYENAITKELKWFNSQENIILNEKGIWTNIGQELLIFNGEFLTYYTQRKDDKNNLTLIKTQYPAVSGKPDENSNFDYSKNAQAKPFKGPILEGDYSINPQEIQKFDELNFFNKTISTFGIAGKFKGGKIAWGDERVWITPSSVQVANPNAENEFINRSNFSIHGGSTPGSAGCIDLHKNAHSFFNKLSQSNSSFIRLRVKY